MVAIRQANDVQSAAESVANKTVALTSELRVYSTYAQLQAAIGRMQSTLGILLATDDEILDLDPDKLANLLRERRSALDAGKIQ